MKIFLQRELKEAYAHAAAGGQALHICDARAFVTESAPACFRRSQKFAHLLDQGCARLVASAKKFGVRVIEVEAAGTHRQHVDLCGKPLLRAINQADRMREAEKRRASEVLRPMDLESALSQGGSK
jgi:hypothetical protein